MVTVENKLKESKPGSRETRYKAVAAIQDRDDRCSKELETKIQGGLKNIKGWNWQEHIVTDW